VRASTLACPSSTCVSDGSEGSLESCLTLPGRSTSVHGGRPTRLLSHTSIPTNVTVARRRRRDMISAGVPRVIYRSRSRVRSPTIDIEKTTTKPRAGAPMLSGEFRSGTRCRAGRLARLRDAYGCPVRAVPHPVCTYLGSDEGGRPSPSRRTARTWISRDAPHLDAWRTLVCLCSSHARDAALSPVRHRSRPCLRCAWSAFHVPHRRSIVFLVDTPLMFSSTLMPLCDLWFSYLCGECAPSANMHR
jgi:hypothetical protein